MRQPGKIVRDADIPPRERILDAACELFYSRGIRCVSVDDIAAAANTNKNTLYRHFESKDLLVAEYLRALNDYGRARFMEAVNAHPGDAYEQLRAYIDRVGEDLSHSGVRGCPMANAAVELPQKDHPARAVIEESKKEHCAALIDLCRDAGIVEPERLADELFLLFEGACVDVQISGPDGPGANFARVAHALIDLHPRNATSPTA